MTYRTFNISRNSSFTSASSLSVIPRFSSAPKMVWFKVCKTCCDRNNIKYVDIAENNTLEQLKWEIEKQLNLKTNPSEFSLTVFDEVTQVWKPVSEENPHSVIVNLPFLSYSFLNVEKREEINTSQQQRPAGKETRLTMKLCERPMDKSSFIDLSTYSSATLRQLKEQAQKKVVNQRARHLFLWTNDEWTKFERNLEDDSLAELGFIDYSFISLEPEDDPIPGVCGLTNLGNTCFMNSALQCLSHIPDLTRKILSSDDQMNAPIIGAYSRLIKTLWSGEHFVITPSSLLLNICENMPRFKRYRQYDAQEFMNCFLHSIHQELTDQRTLITDLFFGQVQSSVKCLGGCHSVETNEEVISFLPLPIEDDSNKYDLLYLRSNGERRFVSVHACVKTVDALIKSFIEQHEPKLLHKHIEAFRIVDNRIEKKYSPYTYLDDIIKHQLTFIELPEKTVDRRYIEFQFHNQETREPFRPPLFLVRPSYGCRYSNLSEQINQIQDHLGSITDAPTSAYRLYCVNDKDETRDLDTEIVKDSELLFIHCLIIAIDPKWIQKYMDHYSFERPSSNASLNNLLTDFFREDLLNGDYYCSECSGLKEAKQKANLALPLPRVLIIQLKRFTYDICSDAKIDTFIDFPLKDLDLNEYIAQDDGKKTNVLALYDLVAVSNHSGTLVSGHYITYARNYRNKRWYSFNDGITREIRDEKNIVTKNAYILVYVKRTVF